MEHDNLFIQILEILSIKHTEDFTIRYYERHPHKNNLFGLSEMLRYYNIENVAAEIQKTQENLSSLDVPFVAYVDHEFVSVRHVSTEAIIYSWRGKNITLSIPVFLERWSGIVLLFESTDESIEPDYKEHRKEYLRQRIVIACFVSLLLSLIGCALITNRGMEIGIWGLWGVNVIGASFCGILLSREILGSDKYVNKICSLFLKSSDCNLWGILPLRNCSPDWQRYVNELRKSINLDIIYNREIKGKDIYISNGYASLYFLLEGLKRDFPEYTIPFNPHLIYDRIISSDAWDALMENEYYYNIHRGLLNGFPGTVLALLNIKQRYLCE